jgi:D-3-phosphoglycerate dehydrogenase
LARNGFARVIACDPYIIDGDFPAYVQRVDLPRLFEQADVVSLHVPLTDETRGMINTDTLRRMKDGVVIINTARGKCVVEADLVAALRSGKVRAYATDVFFSDPPPADCPLYDAPNVIMTPHLGASSDENMLRIGDVVVRILEDFVHRTA